MTAAQPVPEDVRARALDRPGAAAAAESDADGSEHLRAGALVGVGFPRPLALEALLKVERVLGIGVEYSMLPGMTISDVQLSLWGVAADTRFFPFGGAFFIGLRAGYQHLGGRTSVALGDLGTVGVAATVDTTFINPRLGFLWTWGPGVSLGLDAGVQIPLGMHSQTRMPELASGSVVDQEVSRVTHDLGRTVLPTLDLLRVGVLL